jgi:hypothetical protein
MAARETEPSTTIELDDTEVALIIGEADGSMSVRVVAGKEVDDDASEMPAAPEIVLAIAMRLLRDPNFHDEMLDWYDEHQDELDDNEN